MNRIVMDQKLNKIQSFNYPPRMIRVTVDEVVGMKNAYGDSVNNKSIHQRQFFPIGLRTVK